MNTDDIRFLSFYLIPKNWNIHLIDRQTNEKQLQQIQQIIENARLFAFDTETMPSFYHSNYQQNKYDSTSYQIQQSNSCISKPSLLQVAVRNYDRNDKNVLLFDLQELFDKSYKYFRECHTSIIIHNLIQLIFNHPNAYKLSQSLFNDLAHLKCSYNENCFHQSKLQHIIELSDIYRQVFPNEKIQQIYGLQRMTAMTLHCQLDKKQQCANWSKRPLTQSLKDYAAIDVIVMIDIYERLKTKIQENQEWEIFQQSIVTSIDLNDIILYECLCGERFITNKTRNKHARLCPQVEKKSTEESLIIITSDKHHRKKKTHNNTSIKTNITDISSLPELDYDAPPPSGRGYIPPALKLAYQSRNQVSLYEQVRCSSAFNELNQFNENRPPDAQYFLEDDDTEVAQAFGIKLENVNTKSKINRIQSTIPIPKQNLKIAAYPPKSNSLSSNIKKSFIDENDLLDRLKDDFDSQPEFHCHLFGLGGRGRGRSLSIQSSPPKPSFTRQNDYRSLQ